MPPTESTCRNCGNVYQCADAAFCPEHGLCIPICCKADHWAEALVGEMERPVFDSFEDAYIANDGGDLELVVHRNVDGEPYLAHTPMGKDDITCSVCASGVRVYMLVTE